MREEEQSVWCHSDNEGYLRRVRTERGNWLDGLFLRKEEMDERLELCEND